jgi:MFS family permease
MTSRPWWLFAIALAAFAVQTDDFVIIGVLPALAEGLAVSEGAAGQLVTVFTLVYVVAAPVSAHVFARAGRRPLMVGALVLFCAANFVVPLVEDYAVLTHHFADKDALLNAVLARLDEQQHAALAATPGWTDPSVGIGTIVADAWRRHLSEEELPRTRLVHEIEGLAAAGRLTGHVPAFVTGRAEFAPRRRPRQGDLAEQRLRGPPVRHPDHRRHHPRRSRPHPPPQPRRLLDSPTRSLRITCAPRPPRRG